MNAFIMRPAVHKTLNYFFAYVLFALFAILALEVVVNLHAALLRISLLATSRYGVSNFVIVWGAFFLFAIYVVAVVLLENIMNKSAQTGRMLPVGLRIFAVELGLALLAYLAPLAAQWIFLTR